MASPLSLVFLLLVLLYLVLSLVYRRKKTIRSTASLWEEAISSVEAALATSGKEQKSLWKKADHLFRMIAARRPDFGRLWLEWGNMALWQARTASPNERKALWQKATDYYQKATSLMPKDPHPFLYLAMLDLDQATQAPTPTIRSDFITSAQFYCETALENAKGDPKIMAAIKQIKSRLEG